MLCKLGAVLPRVIRFFRGCRLVSALCENSHLFNALFGLAFRLIFVGVGDIFLFASVSACTRCVTRKLNFSTLSTFDLGSNICFHDVPSVSRPGETVGSGELSNLPNLSCCG